MNKLAILRQCLLLVALLFLALGEGACGASLEDKLTWSNNDYYGALGIEKSTTKSELRKAYRKLSLEFHPDKTTLPKDEATVKFYDVSQAYELLKNEGRRAEYDEFIRSLPSQFRPVYGQSRLFKPGVWAVVVPFFLVTLVGISILQIFDFRRKRAQVMQSLLYKKQLESLRKKGGSVADFDLKLFEREGISGWNDTAIFTFPRAILRMLVCAPCRDRTARKVAEKQAAEQRKRNDAMEEERRRNERELKQKAASEKRAAEDALQKKFDDERNMQNRIDFVSKNWSRGIFEALLEMVGLSKDAPKEALLVLILDEGDGIKEMVDAFIEVIEDADAEERQERLEQEERLREEEERRQREELMSGGLYAEDNGDAGETLYSDEEEVDEEWLKELEAEKLAKQKKAKDKKKKKNADKKKNQEANEARKQKQKVDKAKASKKKQEKQRAIRERKAKKEK
jgi:curved DNA-binding protein CbpA